MLVLETPCECDGAIDDKAHTRPWLIKSLIFRRRSLTSLLSSRSPSAARFAFLRSKPAANAEFSAGRAARRSGAAYLPQASQRGGKRGDKEPALFRFPNHGSGWPRRPPVWRGTRVNHNNYRNTHSWPGIWPQPARNTRCARFRVALYLKRAGALKFTAMAPGVVQLCGDLED